MQDATVRSSVRNCRGREIAFPSKRSILGSRDDNFTSSLCTLSTDVSKISMIWKELSSPLKGTVFWKESNVIEDRNRMSKV